MQQDPTVRGGTYLKVDYFNYISYQELLEKTDNLDACELVLYIDKGGTEGDGDPTAGLLMLRGNTRPFRYYILHYFSKQVNYANRIEYTQDQFDEYKQELQDTKYADIEIWQEQERNSSAKNIREIEEEDFEGYPINFDMPRGNTAQRARLVSKLLERERYVIVKGWLSDSWIKPYTSELGKFNPKRKKQPDDAVDTTSGATRCVQRQGRKQGRLSSRKER
jgi:phage terminase large subunit-like protein